MEDKKMLNDEELDIVTGGREEGYYYCPHCGAQHTFEQTKCCHCRSCKIPTNFEDASGRLLDYQYIFCLKCTSIIKCINIF